MSEVTLKSIQFLPSLPGTEYMIPEGSGGGVARLLGKRTELPDGADLNGYTTPGCYCSTNSENNFSNYPAGNTAFILDVEDATGSGRQAPTAWSYGRQVLHALHEHSIWYRDFETDGSGTLTWGEWYEITELPAVTSADNGKVLGVVGGAWAAVSLDSLIPAAEGVSF